MSPHSHGTMTSFEMFTRSVHQPSPLDKLNEHQSQTLRYTAIALSVILIASGLVGFYMLGAIDARRRVFRHHLVFFLIGYDFLKAVTLLFYPARVAIVKLAYYNDNFCDIVGFFTAMAIEGADIAIFSFAIHTALLIFAPNRKYQNGDKIEGGLFPYRFYVWALSLVVPVVFASLAFIRGVGYQPLTNWCYLPERPRWYRLVLSWVPRYVIVVTIIIIYCAIYIHVIRQFNKILYIHEDINKTQSHRLKLDRHLLKNVRYLAREFMKGPSANRAHESVTDMAQGQKEANNDPLQLQKQLHEATMTAFEQRRLQIEKQMKSIFIYPISYIFLWLAPFALQCIQYDYELRHGPVYWLTAISAFMQPFNCTIDTIVFLFRERPWNYTVLSVTRKIKSKHGHMYANDHYAHYYDSHETWRKYLAWLPLYHIPGDNYSVDSVDSVIQDIAPPNPNTHDFSNILASALDESEFRLPAPVKKSPENPFIEIQSVDPSQTQKRSDTVISTSDFYNIPHKQATHGNRSKSSMLRFVLLKPLNETDEKHAISPQSSDSNNTPNLFGDYQLKQSSKNTSPPPPTPPNLDLDPINSRKNSALLKKKNSFLRKTAALGAGVAGSMGAVVATAGDPFTRHNSSLENNPDFANSDDDSLIDFLEFLNRGPP